MNHKDVTLSKLALAGTMYDSLTPFNRSLGRLNRATRGKIDLTSASHRDALLKWLNAWGCRGLSRGQHGVASRSISSWYEEASASLFTRESPLWELADDELEVAAHAYGSLKEKTGARRIRDGKESEVRIGPTAASKILFAIRPKAMMPWDEAMRSSFGCDGSPASYCRYLKEIRSLTFHIGVLCNSKGFLIDNLPQELRRPKVTVLALVNEYIWVTETRQVKLPSAQTLARWAELG